MKHQAKRRFCIDGDAFVNTPRFMADQLSIDAAKFVMDSANGYIDFSRDSGRFTLWNNPNFLKDPTEFIGRLLRARSMEQFWDLIFAPRPRNRSFSGFLFMVFALLTVLAAFIAHRVKAACLLIADVCSWICSDCGGGAVFAKLQAIS